MCVRSVRIEVVFVQKKKGEQKVLYATNQKTDKVGRVEDYLRESVSQCQSVGCSLHSTFIVVSSNGQR
jgi:hypothetical protein